MAAILWTDLWPNSRSDLSDGDIISVQITRNVVGVSGVRVVLNPAEVVTWWKGFQLVNAAGGLIGRRVGVQDGAGAVELDYTMAQVGGAARLQLWKAKFLGVHTPMYDLADLPAQMLPGTVIEFRWLQDSGHRRLAKFTSAHFTGVQSYDNNAMTLQVTAGASFSLETRLLNDNSTIDFDPALDFMIGSQAPMDNASWGNNRWALPGRVLSNQGLNVTLNLTAPAQPGTTPLALRMVQDGVEWFGDTLTFNATVTAGAPAPQPPSTCVLAMLATVIGLPGAPRDAMLDASRQVRERLQSSESGARLVELYYEMSATPEVQQIIRADLRLQWHCLRLTQEVIAASRKPRGWAAPGFALPSTLTSRIADVAGQIASRGSAPTAARLHEVGQLIADFSRRA